MFDITWCSNSGTVLFNKQIYAAKEASIIDSYCHISPISWQWISKDIYYQWFNNNF